MDRTVTGERPPFDISRRQVAGIPVVEVHGEVDMYTAPALEEGLAQALAKSSRIVVDLCEVTFMDSSGLSALVTAGRQRAGESHIAVACTPGAVSRLFDMVRAGELFDLYESTEDAIANLS